MKKKFTWKEKLQYRFDNLMAKGTITMICLLACITLIVVVIAGILSAVLDDSAGLSIGKSTWMSLMHAIDAGTLAGDDGSILFIILMSIVTICGLFITSMLIGIINTGLENKMTALRKGKSHVLEEGHVILLGFNEASFTILTELVAANENQKNCVVVVMDAQEKEEMEDAIAQRIPNTKTTRIICRSGRIEHFADLNMCSIDSCSSIIINTDEDAATIKSILATASLLNQTGNADAHITALVHNEDNLQAAKIAAEGKAEVLYFQSTIARIMAHACRQPGISTVFTELFGYGGDEIYVEKIPGLEGKRMGDLNLYFPESTVIGLSRDGQSMLNPPADTVVQPNDRLIIIEEDDGVSIPSKQPATVNTISMTHNTESSPAPQNMLVLGYSPLLDIVLTEEDKYVSKDSLITIAPGCLPLNELQLPDSSQIQNLTIQVKNCNIYDRAELEALICSCSPENILVLADDDEDDDTADANTLLLLLLLRDIARQTGRNFTVTSEMRKAENQELARVTKVNDFVIGNNITALIMTQISQTRELSVIFEDLLDEEGSELYMKPALHYVNPNEVVDFYTAGAAAAAYNEVFIGYKKTHASGKGFSIIVNPSKAATEMFTADDYFIVVAED